MALNDVLHERKDRLLGKRRPIVTGEVSRTVARVVTFLLFSAGIASAFLAGVGWPGVLLVALIVLYNVLAGGRIKGAAVTSPLGMSAAAVAVIAACRALHVLLPALAYVEVTPLTRQPVAWVFAGSVFAYFCLVTTVSLFEDRGGGRMALGVVAVLLLPVALAVPCCVFGQPTFMRLPPHMEAPFGSDLLAHLIPVVVLAILAWLLWALWRALAKAAREPTPPNIGRAVGTGIRGEALLMCLVALAMTPAYPWWGLLALACYPVGKLLSRWVSPT
jgi:4-hydroxybenzoate polyprenyltransferase